MKYNRINQKGTVKYIIQHIEPKVVKDQVSNFKKLESAKEVYQLMTELQNSANEKFVAISLNCQNRILCIEVVAIGTTDTALIEVKCALRTAILVNASAVVFVHNHPSGNPYPSSADKNLTQHLFNACKLLDIKMQDHVIIGSDSYFSFGEQGLI